MHRAAVVLPDPDSPTMPSVSPGRTSNEMLSTALKISTFLRQPEPTRVSKCFERFRTRRSGKSPVTRASGPCEFCRSFEGFAALITTPLSRAGGPCHVDLSRCVRAGGPEQNFAIVFETMQHRLTFMRPKRLINRPSVRQIIDRRLLGQQLLDLRIAPRVWRRREQSPRVRVIRPLKELAHVC